jgi:N-acetylglutamate synthase-like GNAT family acetyltransferase
MIRRCEERDYQSMYEIINDAAQAYKGIIPEDRWHEPYMPAEELKQQMDEGVQFWGYEKAGQLVGVMGVQPKGDVTLIRHAYVRTAHRNEGIGGKLLTYLCSQTEQPVLIGTWAAANWAISFYERHGFRVVSDLEKEQLLRRYWSIPERQIATSVVLVDARW